MLSNFKGVVFILFEKFWLQEITYTFIVDLKVTDVYTARYVVVYTV